MLLLFLALTTAHAGKSDCDAVKPEQQLETHRQQQIDGMVKVGIAGFGRGEAKAHSDVDVTYDTQLLETDDLARSWYVYQLCVLKRDGVIGVTVHEELMRELFGLERPTSTAPPAVGVAPTQVTAVDMAEEDGTSLGVVRGTATPEALEMYLASELDARQRKKYPNVGTVVFDASGKSFGVGSTVSATATVMCGSDARKVVIPPATSTGTWSYKGKWLAKRILKEADCR